METVIRNCPDCGTILTETILFGKNFLSGKSKRLLKCPKCGWGTYI